MKTSITKMFTADLERFNSSHSDLPLAIKDSFTSSLTSELLTSLMRQTQLWRHNERESLSEELKVIDALLARKFTRGQITHILTDERRRKCKKEDTE